MSENEDEEIERIQETSMAIPTGTGEYLEECLEAENGAVTVGSHDQGKEPIHLSIRADDGSAASVTLSEMQAQELHHWVNAHSTGGA